VTVEDRAAKVVEALRKQPDLFYEVLRKTYDTPVLGPWRPLRKSDIVGWARYGPGGPLGEMGAHVKKTFSTNYDYQWSVEKPYQAHSYHATEEEAKQHVDTYLRRNRNAVLA